MNAPSAALVEKLVAIINKGTGGRRPTAKMADEMRALAPNELQRAALELALRRTGIAP